jgi:AraC-like DNA-binding protein
MNATLVSRVFATPVTGVFLTHSAGGRQFEKHWHDTYTFGLLDAGAQSWLSGRGHVDAYAGDVINTNPGEVHDGRPLGGPSRCWRMVSLDVAVFAGMLGHDGVPPEITRPVIHDGELRLELCRLFDPMEHTESFGGDAVVALAFEEHLVESCVRLMGRHSSVPVTPRRAAKDVSAVRDLLADDPCQAHSLSAMAAMSGLSKFQFLRRFKRDFGLPPHRWLQCQRAERARGLIRRGRSLPHAALDTGFADQSHMTRIFQRVYGYTPGHWQRAMSGGRRSQ